MPDAVGVPLIVIVLEAHAAVTPDGKPVAVPIPVARVVTCVISVKEVLIHRVGVEEGVPAVMSGITVIVPLAVLGEAEQPPVMVTV